MSNEEITQIWYYSVDNNSNIETTKNVTVRISTTEETDLVGFWHFDEGTGGIAADSSGNGNAGTLVNNPSWVNGKLEKVLRFDGINDYVSIPNSLSLNPENEITIIAWVNPGVIPQTGWNKIIAKPYTSYTSPWQQYALTLHDNQFVFELNTEGTNQHRNFRA
jgi:hypothetical protein